MRRSILSARLVILLVLAQTFLIAQPLAAEDLSLFQRYFGTMDYSVIGTGSLQGSGKKDQVTGEYLSSKSVTVDYPRKADLVAAFFYWQTHETSAKPASARGYISYPSDPNARVKFLGKPVGRTDLFLPCWNTGGTGGSTKDKALLRMYRADVLRYLKDPATGDIATSITVRLPDGGGSGNGVGLVAGGSLVLIYRHPSLSFKSIVIYDGTGTMDATTPLFVDLKGFDQASQGQAKITHGVGNGQANFSEKLWFNGVDIQTNPFQNGWDNITIDVTPYMGSPVGTFPPADTPTPINHVTTSVTPFGKADCLSWGFVVFSTTVQDTDEDGLLDTWEKYGVKDVNTGAVTVDLPNMRPPFGSAPNRLHKDLLAEIDYMYDDDSNPQHYHWPKSKALQMVGDAFKNAPVANPDGVAGINVIFDVKVPGTNPYLLNPYVLATLNEGGDQINERAPALYCGTDAQAAARNCPFPNQPGVISWKKGIQHIKNNFFNEARQGIYHYVVFGHQLGLREEITPYLGKSNSGRADLPGDTVVVTLGRWRSSGTDTFVGSAELQAAVFLHELSHNLWGYHGGTTLEFSAARPLTILDKIEGRPNCNNKQSSLNYLYLSAGLLDSNGVFNVNLSGEVLQADAGVQDEGALKELLGLSPLLSTPYRLRWYAPLANVQNAFKKKADGTQIPLAAASRHCDGTPKGPGEPAVARVDGLGVNGDPLAATKVDWNRDGSFNTLPGFLDINFNGKQDSTQDLRGFNDWKSIIDLHGLQQVGSGRNLFALSLLVGASDLLRFTDQTTLAEDDLAEDDLAEDDLAEDDLGPGDNMAEDDLAEDDLAEDDLAEDDLGEVSDIDESLAAAIGGNGPTSLAGTLLTGPRRILLTWSPPAFGGALTSTGYYIYRSVDGAPYDQIGTSATPGTTASPFVDSNNIQPNKTYSYVIIAEFAANSPDFPTVTLSTPSNAISIRP